MQQRPKKALAVGIFYLLGGVLAVAPWPAIVPSVLLGSGMALLVYHFLGGIAQDDRINWSVGQKAAVQIGGASVILLASSYWINFYLEKAKQNSLVVEPESQNLIVLNQKGEPVDVKIRRGLELPQKLNLYKGDLRDLNLSIQYIDGRLFVKPSGNSTKQFVLGNIDDPAPDQSLALTDFIYQASENDYFNPALVALRKAICAGAACPNSFAGFPIAIKRDKEVEKGKLFICVSNPDITEAFATISAKRDPKQYISSLYIAPSKDSPSENFKPFQISLISPKENISKCRSEKQRIVGLVNPEDYKNLSISSERTSKKEMYATTQPP